MSSQARLGSALAALAVLAGSSPASLSARQTEEELERRVRELLPLVEEARSAAQQAQVRLLREERTRNRTVTDTVQVGPLTIVTLPDQAELARELFERIWTEEYVAAAGTRALVNPVFVFQWRTPLESIYVPGMDGNGRIEVQRYRSRETVEEAAPVVAACAKFV